MNLLPGLQSTASALDAEKLRMNIVAENIANAYTTRGEDGQPYRRKIVTFESVLSEETGKGIDATTKTPIYKVGVSNVSEDNAPFKTVYDPQHPDADENGMVSLPNVDMSREMVDMIVSSRAYEANLQAAKMSRQMAKDAMTIGSKS